MKKLFYCEEEGNFYWVTDRDKTILIEWHPEYSGEDQLDQGVMYKKLVVTKKAKVGGHPIEEYTDTTLLIYPYQAGQPFYLERATMEHIKKEIELCDKYGVGHKYYEDLKQYIAEAYLVTFEITTRVVSTGGEENICEKAKNRIARVAGVYLVPENVIKIRVDQEMPYGALDADLEEKL